MKVAVILAFSLLFHFTASAVKLEKDSISYYYVFVYDTNRHSQMTDFSFVKIGDQYYDGNNFPATDFLCFSDNLANGKIKDSILQVVNYKMEKRMLRRFIRTKMKWYKEESDLLFEQLKTKYPNQLILFKKITFLSTYYIAYCEQYPPPVSFTIFPDIIKRNLGVIPISYH